MLNRKPTPINQSAPEQIIDKPRVFRMPLAQRVFFGIFFGLGTAVPASFVLAWLTRDLARCIVATVLYAGVAAAFTFWYYSSYALWVSSDAIEYRVAGHQVRANWNEIVEVAVVGGWVRPVRGLHVSTKSKPITVLSLFFIFPSSDVRYSIPLAVFSTFNWENSEVVSEVRRHRPDLFGLRQVK